MSADRGIAWNVVHRAPWWVPWLLIFLMFFSWAVFQFLHTSSGFETNQEAREIIRQANIESCGRVNILRAEVNTQTEVLREVMTTAAESALDSGNSSRAQEYLDSAARLQDIDLTNCENAFPEEMEQAGFAPINGEQSP